MGQVWKFTLQPTSVQGVEMPKGASILSAQEQRGAVNLWAHVDPAAGLETRSILMIGTGQEIDAGVLGPYIGTVQVNQGDLVLHLFEVA